MHTQFGDEHNATIFITLIEQYSCVEVQQINVLGYVFVRMNQWIVTLKSFFLIIKTVRYITHIFAF